MTTQLSPERLAVPPPSMLHLNHADHTVGWINGDRVGFRGFATDGQGTDDHDSYGFELAIPQPADEVLVRAMAHLIYRTLRKSGVRWGSRPRRVNA